MSEPQLNNTETAAHLRRWCEADELGGHGAFSWPTDGCGYDQHIRFVQHRNANWQGGDRTQFRNFVLAYAAVLSEIATTDQKGDAHLAKRKSYIVKAWAVMSGSRLACWDERLPITWLRRPAKELAKLYEFYGEIRRVTITVEPAKEK